MAGQRSRSSFDLDEKAFKAGLAQAAKRMDLRSAEDLERLGYKVVNGARRYCPVDSNRLRGSIDIQERGRDAKGPFVVVGTPVEYAGYVEFGTPPHKIRPKNKKALANRKGGFGPVSGVVNHPGTDPQPFMRPALLEAATNWQPRITP